MAGIIPTSGVRPPMMPAQVSPAAQQKPAEAKASFAQMLKSYVGEVDGKQQASYEAMKDLISGKAEDVLPVVNAVAKADVSFKLLMGVRNKVIEAYKQTMNMQV